MSEALVIMVVLTAALLIAVLAVLVLARRKAPAAPVLDEDALRRLVEQAVGRPVAEAGPSRRRRPSPTSVGLRCSVTRRPPRQRPLTPFVEPLPRPRMSCSSGPDGTPIRSGPTPGRRRNAPSRPPGRRQPNCAPGSSPSETASPWKRPQRCPRIARNFRKPSNGCAPPPRHWPTNSRRWSPTGDASGPSRAS